jgi:hypothetical protein
MGGGGGGGGWGGGTEGGRERDRSGVQRKGTQAMKTRHHNRGLRKVCGTAHAAIWAKCAHSWHFNFKPAGEEPALPVSPSIPRHRTAHTSQRRATPRRIARRPFFGARANSGGGRVRRRADRCVGNFPTRRSPDRADPPPRFAEDRRRRTSSSQRPSRPAAGERSYLSRFEGLHTEGRRTRSPRRHCPIEHH